MARFIRIKGANIQVGSGTLERVVRAYDDTVELESLTMNSKIVAKRFALGDIGGSTPIINNLLFSNTMTDKRLRSWSVFADGNITSGFLFIKASGATLDSHNFGLTALTANTSLEIMTKPMALIASGADVWIRASGGDAVANMMVTVELRDSMRWGNAFAV